MADLAETFEDGGAIEIELSRRTKLRLQKLGASVLPGHKRPSRKGHSTQHLRIRHAFVVIPIREIGGMKDGRTARRCRCFGNR